MKNYTCHACGKQFGTRQLVRSHIKKVHKRKCVKNDPLFYDKNNANTKYASPVTELMYPEKSEVRR